MSDPRMKQLKIKTGVLKRVGKEKLSYRKEADQQKAKIEKMKAEGREEVTDSTLICSAGDNIFYIVRSRSRRWAR